MYNVEDFKTPKHYKGTLEDVLVISKLPVVDYKTITDINNDAKYDWHTVVTVHQDRHGKIVRNDSKYGRIIYCPKTNTARTQTMGEFYGGSVVD